MFDFENFFFLEISYVGKGLNLVFFNIFKNYLKVKFFKFVNLNICLIGD